MSVTTVVAPVACHVPSLGRWAKTSRVTVSPVTAFATVSVPLLTNVAGAHTAVRFVIAWLPSPARAPEASGLPTVPNPIRARPPAATTAPPRRAATVLLTRAVTVSVTCRISTRALFSHRRMTRIAAASYRRSPFQPTVPSASFGSSASVGPNADTSSIASYAATASSPNHYRVVTMAQSGEAGAQHRVRSDPAFGLVQMHYMCRNKRI